MSAWIVFLIAIALIVSVCAFIAFHAGVMAGERRWRKEVVERGFARWETTTDGVTKFWWN